MHRPLGRPKCGWEYNIKATSLYRLRYYRPSVKQRHQHVCSIEEKLALMLMPFPKPVKTLHGKTNVKNISNLALSSVLAGGQGGWRFALFCDIKQRRMVILYRRFGTTYWSHLQGSKSPSLDLSQRRMVILYRRFGITYRSHFQGSRSPSLDFLTLENGTDTLSQHVGKGLPFVPA
jgi:hypothetical protein